MDQEQTVKIAFCDDSNIVGGAQVALIRMVTELLKIQHFKLICFISKDNCRLWEKLSSQRGLKVVPGYSAKPLNIVTHLFQMKKRAELKAAILKERPDVIVINQSDIESGLIYKSIAESLKTPYCGWMHNPVRYGEMFKTYGLGRRMLAMFRDYVADHYFIRKYSKIIAVSEYTKSILLKRKVPANKITVVLNAVYSSSRLDVTVMRNAAIVAQIAKWKKEYLIVGMIARIDFCAKGHDILVKAASILKAKGKKCKYIVVGDGRNQILLDNLVQKNGLGDDFLLTGWIDDASSLIRDMDLIVIPSRQETVNLVALEAICLGINVIGSRIKALEDILHPSQLFNPDDPGDLAANIDRALSEKVTDEIRLHYKAISSKHSSQLWVNNFLSAVLPR